MNGLSGKNLRLIIGAVVVALILAGVAVTVYLTQQNQDPRSRADEPNAVCTPPPAPTNVKIEYPNCEGQECSFTKANCTWETPPEASGSSVLVIEVESNTTVLEATYSAEIKKTVFDVTTQKTYKCSVSVFNSCGQTSNISSHQVLCDADIPFNTPTPTIFVAAAPTNTPTPTLTLSPTPTRTPTPTIRPSATPVPTTGSTPIPTVFATIAPTLVPTSIPAATLAPTTAPTLQPTAVPTIPNTGSTATTIGAIGIVLVLIVGGAILLIF